MANGKIQLDTSRLAIILNNLKASMEEFESYTMTFRTQTRDQLDDFQSDFASKASELLTNMRDDVKSDLLDKLTNLHACGESILTKMQEQDEALSQAMQGGKR
ncbi:hypothetical protein [Amphibacillus jilinensis]|uniref:hypothetical protein n=2 Tax=Amphibacillus jilinensis TaxID=1216008 RepID=UPI0002D2E791|nr:hypothetical protein [Amphibacillus jilinensis]